MEKSSADRNFLDKILIVSITPYFLDRESFWFEQNINKILEARKTQPFFQDNTIYAEKGEETKLSEFLRKLDEMGYENVQNISEPGELSRRGGIIDVFPLNSKHAVRVEFYGNLIENIEKLPLAIEDEKEVKERIKKKLKRQKIYSQLGTLKPGDYLVHLDHGIGRLAGFADNYYILEYAQNDKLYIPKGLERKLSRYIGFTEPKISRLSSPAWIKTKGKIKEGA